MSEDIGEESKPSDRLTHKRYLFCLEYVKDYNGTQAAIRAGYAESGAGVEANRLLNIAKIQETIAELESDRLEAAKITGEKVIKGIARLAAKAEAKDDISNAIRAHDLLGRGKLWDKGGGGIKGIESKPDGTMKITFEENE